MKFSYLAYSVEQGTVKGEIEAKSEAEARHMVALQGYRPLRIAPARSLLSGETLAKLFPMLFHVGTGELVRFSRQLAVMLGSGGNLMRTLEMLARGTRNSVMRRILEDLQRNLDEGSTFSAALAQHPTVFSPLYISVVEVGEHSGNLAPALEQLSDMVEQEHEAKMQAIRTMMYPAAIMLLSVLTLGRVDHGGPAPLARFL